MKLTDLTEDVIDFAAKKAERQKWYAVVWKMLEETMAEDPGMDDVGMVGPTDAPIGHYILNQPGKYLPHAVTDEARIVVAQTKAKAVTELENWVYEWIEEEIYFPDYYEDDAPGFGETFRNWTKA